MNFNKRFLLNYFSLTPFNVGNVKRLSNFCQDVDDTVNGAYRELDEFLPVLAELYIEIDQLMGDNSYSVAIGADGAPLGKYDETTVWLVSFLNSGDRITSQNENFLITGGNCVEDHICMKRYERKIASDMQVIVCKEYLVKQFKVIFSFQLVPADMKWLPSFSGELSNAGYYFSSFANFNDDNKHTVNGTLGPGSEATWQPWVYAEGLEVVEAVDKRKEELSKQKLSEGTVRRKTREHIDGMSSRQEFSPLMGSLIDKGYAVPLHNSNNAWQYFHEKLLELAIAKSNIQTSCVDISVLSNHSFIHSPIRKF